MDNNKLPKIIYKLNISELKCFVLPRRVAMLFLGSAVLGAGGCGSLRREPERQYTAAQKRMLAKFGGIGYGLVVDAVKGQEIEGLLRGIEEDTRFFMGSAVKYNSITKSVQGGPVPEQVRAIWRKSAIRIGVTSETYYPDEIVGDEILEVGSRVPQDLVDDLRRDPLGSLRLKFRMSEQGTMFGWDIERRPGYDPKIRDSHGLSAYVAPVHSFAGGDFREAQIYNGKPVRLGWYIDRQTGQKIETDY